MFPAALISGLAILLLTMFIGRRFCGYACPFGTIQELIFSLNKKSGKFKLPEKPEKGLISKSLIQESIKHHLSKREKPKKQERFLINPLTPVPDHMHQPREKLNGNKDLQKNRIDRSFFSTKENSRKNSGKI